MKLLAYLIPYIVGTLVVVAVSWGLWYLFLMGMPPIKIIIVSGHV